MANNFFYVKFTRDKKKRCPGNASYFCKSGVAEKSIERQLKLANIYVLFTSGGTILFLLDNSRDDCLYHQELLNSVMEID